MMVKKIKILLIGDGVLKETLKGLTSPESMQVIRSATRDALKLVQKHTKSLAPKDTGALRRSLRVRATKRSRVRVGARVTTSASDNMYSGKTFYGAFQEFGWKTKERKDACKRAASAMTRRLMRLNARQGRLSPFAAERALQQVRIAEYADRKTANRKPAARKQINAREFMKRGARESEDSARALFLQQVREHVKKVLSKRKR